jgi:hypothetical protein
MASAFFAGAFIQSFPHCFGILKLGPSPGVGLVNPGERRQGREKQEEGRTPAQQHLTSV